MKRRRSIAHTFEDRIATEKLHLKAQAAGLPPGPQKDEVLKKIRITAADLKGASVGPRQTSDPPAIDTTKLETILRSFGDEAGHSAFDSIMTIFVTHAGEGNFPHLAATRA
jgi:hypothetical protein